MKSQAHRSVLVVILTIVLAISLSGCDLIKSPQVQNALATLTAAAGSKVTDAPKSTTAGKATTAPKATVEGEATAESTVAPKATTSSKATTAPKATVKPKATSTPKQEIQELVILEQGFGQDEQEVAYGIVVENPNDSAIIDSQFQITVFDEEGTILDTDSGYLPLILPGQVLYLASYTYLNENQVADTIEIVIETGEVGDTEYNAPLTTDKMVYQEGEYSSVVLGLVNNPFDMEVGNVNVWCVAYDADGNIIGGGQSYVSFIAAGASTGVEMYVTSEGAVDHIEVSAALANYVSYDDPEERIGIEQVSMVKTGLGQKEAEIGYGMLFENASPDSAADSVNVNITFYDDNGDVIAVEDNYISVILPGETQAVAGSSYFEEGVTVASMEIQYRVSKMVPVSDLMPLATSNISYLDDEYSPKVTGQVENPYTIKLESVHVVVIAYDSAGDIIGGGTGYIEFISAGKKAAVEVYLTASEAPDSLEMYASINYLSDMME
ncbi:MAG: FxLYD domain-containing protein [Anaerolineae bacterium]